MPKQHLSLNDFSSGVDTVKDPRDILPSGLVKGQDIMVDKRGAIRTMGSVVSQGIINATPTDGGKTTTCKGGYGLAVLESDYETEALSNTIVGDAANSGLVFSAEIEYIAEITGTAWAADVLTLTTATNHGILAGDTILIVGTTNYNGTYTVISGAGTTITVSFDTDHGSETGLAYLSLPTKYVEGSEIQISGTTDNDGFYTVKYSSANWRLYVDRALTLETNVSGTIKSMLREETFVVLADAANAKVDTYSKNNDLWAVDQMTLDTTGGNLANNAKTVFYAIDGAIRACDGEFGNANIIQWFGLIKRSHFPDCTNSVAEIDYFDFYAKNNNLAIPEDGEVGDTYPDDGEGFDIKITAAGDTDSEWEVATYQIASSFIYDDNQESLLYVPSANNTFAVAEGEGLTLEVHGSSKDPNMYNERISGGRIYARIDDSDDAWFLLCDIDLRQGARATLDGSWKAWEDGATPANGEVKAISIISISQNIDTYETINGYSHEEVSNSMGQNGEGWKTAVVANRRAFVANVRRYDESTGQNKTFADSIVYSQPNKFDTFPTSNSLIVVKGDSESYVCLKAYADRLLAFKQNSVQIINIASPSDTGWFKEDIKKYHGVYHPGAVCDTDFGIAWINKSGCYLYDGSQIRNLIWDKIDAIEWKDFIGAASDNISIIGYERHKKQLIVMRDCTGGQADSGDIYLYDFFTKSWVTGINIFTDAVAHTNFIHDWNGDLVIGYQFDATTIYIMKWSDTSAAKSNITIQTRDIDFGDLLHIKKIYKIYVTYKSSVTQASALGYDTNGGVAFSDPVEAKDFSVATTWDVEIFTFSSPISVQSLALLFSLPSSGTFDINDVTIEFRVISKRIS